MDAGNSSEWLPPGFAEKTEVKNGRNIKYYYNVTTGVKYHSKKDVIHCATEDFFRDAPQKTIFDDNGESSGNKVDAISIKTNKPPKWLPDGWRMEEKVRKNGSSAGTTYKIYIDSSTGSKFYSKLAVARYLKTIDQNDAATEEPKLDNVGEPSLKPDMSLQCKSLSEVDCFPAKNLKRKKSSTVVGTGSTSTDRLPPSEAGSITGKKSKRKKSFTVVDSETTPADVVPPSVAVSAPRKNSKRKKSFAVIDSEITSADVIPPSVAGSTPGKNSNGKKSFTMVDTETTSADVVPSSVTGSTPGKNSNGKKSFTMVDTETTSADVVPSSVAGSTPGKNSKRKKSFTVVAVESTPADGLPAGWVKEIKTSKSGNKIRKDPYYIEPVSGYMFLSKKDALRYLETNDIGSCACMPKRKEFENLKLNKNEVTPDNVGEPLLKPDTFLLSKSMTDTDCSPQKRKSKHSSAMVAAESTSVEGLPPGWIKEILTRKSGNKIRKDAYYTDPVTGYMFRSKNDALRYLKTNDIGSCAVKPKKRELGDLTLIKNKIPVDNVGFTNLKPDAPPQCKSMIDEDCISEKKNKHTSTMVAAENTSTDGLPPGWIKEVKTSKSGNKIRKDSYYIDPVNGYIFHSKKDVLRYLETNDIGSCVITPKRRKLDNFKLIKSGVPVDNVGETFSKPEASLQFKSVTDEGCIPEQKKDKQTTTAVATESTSMEGLPPGWIKEIRTSKSGNKMRKDPYYTDPISGYVFRSKKDVLRYLETNDVGSCSITPKRRELDNLKLIEDKISLNNADEPQLKLDVSVESEPIMDASCITEPKKKILHSPSTVVTEIASDDGLPSGWIKEIKTIQSGDKIRKDPYYTDPISGYVFRSKKDVFRFLKTNDIRSCAVTPKMRETKDLKLIKNIDPLKNVAIPHTMPDVSIESKSMIDTSCATETKKKSQHSSTTVATEFTSDDDLPPGWIKEIRTSESGDKIRKDLYYTDPVSGYIFCSKKDVLRFLETNDIRSCAIRPKRREANDFQSIKDKIPLANSGESSFKPEASMKCESMTDAACIAEIKKNSQHPSSVVATEIASADGLPPGWIKEIKTSQSGDKIRKDPFYTDPVSGYIFRSKKDVMRYLETNDISSCAIRPKRREVDCLESVKKKSSSSTPINKKKLSDQLETKTKLFVGGESNTNGGGGSSTKTRAASKANTLRVVSAGADSLKGQYSCENSNKLFDMKTGAAQTKECSEQGEKVMADVLAICSFINDAFTEEKLPESEMEKRTFTEEKLPDSEMEKRTHGTQSETQKSKRRRDLNLPLRVSKRLAKSEPEVLSNVELSERALRAATKRSSATSVPQPSDLDPAKKAADLAFSVTETLQEQDSLNKVEGPHPLNKVGRPLSEDNTTLDGEVPKKVENPRAEDIGILKEQTEGKTNGKQLNDDVTSQDTQPCYEFGDSWTDPCLEFAYKTLTGEIPLDDTLPFSGIPYNQEDGGIGASASEAPTMFESEIPPGFESTNQKNTVEKVPSNPSFYLSAVDALFESEIPPGFESVAQNKNADKSPANPSFSSPQVSTEQGLSDKSS